MENGLAPSVSFCVFRALSGVKLCGQGRRECEGSTKAHLMCSLDAVKFVKFALGEVSAEM